ncbi:hypothetical protein ACFSR6_06400 [Pedobacter vanadiisoli]|uniref:Lipoprotein n=1 Tax=Pedobacter vanadiisoli TaxID=1761975 RepID=A0ABW5MFW8_9SPHI
MIFSCSKNSVSDSDSENAIKLSKEWYLKINKNSITELTGTNGQSKKVEFSVQWDVAKDYFLGAKEYLVVAPVKLNNNFGDLNDRLFLLIRMSKNEFNQILIYDKDREFQKNDITGVELLKFYDNSKRIVNSHVKKIFTSQVSRNTKLMLTNPGSGDGCIDWYWTVYAYDSDGNPLYVISETFLYQTCPNQPGGDGPTPPDIDELPEPNVSFGEPDATELSVTLESSTAVEKNYMVSWYFYKVNGESLKFKSFEKIKLTPEPIGLPWVVSSIKHISQSLEGTIERQSVSCILNWAEGTVIEQGAYGKMQLSFKDKREYTYKGVLRTRFSEDFKASRAWGTHDLLGD